MDCAFGTQGFHATRGLDYMASPARWPQQASCREGWWYDCELCARVLCVGHGTRLPACGRTRKFWEFFMSAPFAILGIDHVVLRAADPAALERFYLEVLGCTLEKRQGKLTQLRAGRALIDIVPANEAGPAGGTSSTGGANL